jgi:hypothetical protein
MASKRLVLDDDIEKTMENRDLPVKSEEPGPRRPATHHRKQELEEVITLRLEKGVYAKLQKIAKKECVFASMLIRKAVMNIIAENGGDL